MKLMIKRVYEPAADTDSVRVLVDRLWPRGVSKADARIDVWAKELAPSARLRTWFHANPEVRYTEFSKKYRKELVEKKKATHELLLGRKKLTLVTAVRDIEHSHVPTLVAFLRGRAP